MDEIRGNHDAAPTREEAEWVSTDAIALVVRSLGLAGVALIIGVAASMVVSPSQAVAPLAAAASR
ncbi:MAG: hypothetical protein ABIR98_04205 [Usitatibacter sp.]